MTNFPWQSISQMNDIESLGNYRDMLKKGLIDEQEGLVMLRARSRDNARTPMQWDAGENAGFTTGTPWLPVNPNHETINAEEQRSRADSVFHYYQKLIALRKQMDVIVYGHYELLLPEDPDLFVYTREWKGERLLVVCNFSGKEVPFERPQAFRDARRLIANYEEEGPEDIVRPWEATVFHLAK